MPGENSVGGKVDPFLHQIEERVFSLGANDSHVGQVDYQFAGHDFSGAFPIKLAENIPFRANKRCISVLQSPVGILVIVHLRKESLGARHPFGIRGMHHGAFFKKPAALMEFKRIQSMADIIPQAIPPHGQWVAIYLSLFVQAYNTNLISKESLPASYADLVRPQWKDKLAVEADDFDWFAETVKDMGEERGLRLFREIVAANGISVRKGHSLLNNLVAAGEVPLALSDYGYLAEQAKRKGAPLDWLVIPPAIARATAQGLVRNAPHPYAAVLFYDYLISGAQPIFAGRQFIPVSRNLQPPYNVGPLKLIDSAAMLDQSRKWQDLFQKTIIGPSR